MSDELSTQPRVSRRTLIGTGAVLLLGVLVFVFAYFQPHKLFIDDKVEQAAPEGAVVIGAADPPVVSEPQSSEPPVASADVPTTDGPLTTDGPATTDAPAPAMQPAAFISLDHDTTGTVLFLEDPATGERFLRLEELDTDNGPDLKVYLSTNPADGEEGAFDDDFVNLGALQGNKGSQNYLIPEGTDLSRFASVVIWCDRFDSAFGAANLVP